MSTDAPNSSEFRIISPGRAFVYPTAGSGRGDLVSGRGEWAFSIDSASEGGVADLRLTDLDFRFRPGSCVHFDVTGDGLLDRLDLGDFRLRREHLDLEQTSGTMNLATGDVTLRLVFDIDPGEIPGLAGKVDPRPLHFDLTERGRFDLADGRYHTNSDVLTIEDGPFAGLTILNCIAEMLPFHSYTTPTTIALGVYVWPGQQTPTAWLDIPVGQLPKAVWICPGTPISLAWDSCNASTVRIDPDLGDVPVDGRQDIPDFSSLNPKLHAPRTISTTYLGVARSGAVSAEDHVTVNVVGPAGEWFSQTATYQDGTNYWVAYLPAHTYDSRILVTQVIIDGGQADSITHPSWRADHIFDTLTPVGTLISSLDTPAPTGSGHPLPGEYRFTPMPAGAQLPSGERGRTLYFRLFAKPCDV